MARQALSVIVPTLNEAAVLRDCLESVRFADEVIVVDSFSTDATGTIAREAGARFLQHSFADFARQKNWAIEQTTHPWILQVDADERVTPALRDEIRTLLSGDPPHDAYRMPRVNYFLGRRMRHTGWGRDAVIRLFRRTLRFSGEIHEAIRPAGAIPSLRMPLEHHSFRSFAQYGAKLQTYSAFWAARAWREGRRAGPAKALLHPAAHFLKAYVWRLGFLDGGHGLILSLLGAASVYLKYARLWELQVLEGSRAAAPGDAPPPAERAAAEPAGREGGAE